MRCFAQLTDRHLGQARVVHRQAEPAVGHERGVHSAGKADAEAVVVGRARLVPNARLVPVRAAGAA